VVEDSINIPSVSYIHTYIHTYIPWIHEFVMTTIGCGISHKDKKNIQINAAII
jgi:hypothetical protein